MALFDGIMNEKMIFMIIVLLKIREYYGLEKLMVSLDHTMMLINSLESLGQYNIGIEYNILAIMSMLKDIQQLFLIKDVIIQNLMDLVWKF